MTDNDKCWCEKTSSYYEGFRDALKYFSEKDDTVVDWEKYNADVQYREGFNEIRFKEG